MMGTACLPLYAIIKPKSCIIWRNFIKCRAECKIDAVLAILLEMNNIEENWKLKQYHEFLNKPVWKHNFSFFEC